MIIRIISNNNDNRTLTEKPLGTATTINKSLRITFSVLFHFVNHKTEFYSNKIYMSLESYEQLVLRNDGLTQRVTRVWRLFLHLTRLEIGDHLVANWRVFNLVRFLIRISLVLPSTVDLNHLLINLKQLGCVKPPSNNPYFGLECQTVTSYRFC